MLVVLPMLHNEMKNYPTNKHHQRDNDVIHWLFQKVCVYQLHITSLYLDADFVDCAYLVAKPRRVNPMLTIRSTVTQFGTFQLMTFSIQVHCSTWELPGQVEGLDEY